MERRRISSARATNFYRRPVRARQAKTTGRLSHMVAPSETSTGQLTSVDRAAGSEPTRRLKTLAPVLGDAE
jgi:hypothetical protein